MTESFAHLKGHRCRPPFFAGAFGYPGRHHGKGVGKVQRRTTERQIQLD
jgi:hypothetical protein